jgi:hypothetical protein
MDILSRTTHAAVGASVVPLAVSTTVAKRTLGIGNTKFWALVKIGKIKLVDVGTGRRLVNYASLEQLVQPPA